MDWMPANTTDPSAESTALALRFDEQEPRPARYEGPPLMRLKVRLVKVDDPIVDYRLEYGP